MEYRYLGKSGLRVSELCLGTMTFGGGEIFKEFGNIQLTEAKELIGTALDAGINFIDTADVYSQGLSEEIIGKSLVAKREDVILLTKVRFPSYGSGPNDTGLTRYHIIRNVERSLKNLNTDYIDVYMMHAPDFMTPLEESLKAFDDLVKQGKVRYIGCSNFPAWWLMKALWISDKYNYEKFITYQGQYNLASREMELDIIPACMDNGIGIMSWSPLAGGFFSGKYGKNKVLPKNCRRSDPNSQLLDFFPVEEKKGYLIIDKLEKIAKNHKATVAQTALNYLLQKSGIVSIVLGIRNKEQLKDNLKSSEWKMDEEEVAKLDELSSYDLPYPFWHIKMNEGDR